MHRRQLHQTRRLTPCRLDESALLCLIPAQLYRHEHELLRELAGVDGALDDYDRRAEVKTFATPYNLRFQCRIHA